MYEMSCFDSYGNSINYLTQWDYNRKLVMDLNGYDLTVAPEIHFSNKEREEALVVQSTVSSDNLVTVDIPNILLQEPYPLLVYVYLTDSNDTSSQKTIVTTEIPVKKRPKPSDYTYIENIDYVTAEQIKREILEEIVNGDYDVTIDVKAISIQKIEQTVASEEEGGANIITVTLTDGTRNTFKIFNGSKGEKGNTGNGLESIKLNDDYTLTFKMTDGTSYTTSSIRGASGKNGTNGYTPIRGTDYWTADDIAEIKSYVDEAILGGSW